MQTGQSRGPGTSATRLCQGRSLELLVENRYEREGVKKGNYCKGEHDDLPNILSISSCRGRQGADILETVETSNASKTEHSDNMYVTF